MQLRIATFNVENLLSRQRFGPSARPDSAAALALFGFEPPVRDAVERSVSVMLEDDKRQMTGLAIADADADIICLQEVDNLGVLEAFFRNYVHRVADHRYGHFHLVKGNDERGIDVAFACRRDLVSPQQVDWRSHKNATYADFDLFNDDLAAHGLRPDSLIFKRDCLEVSLDIDGRPLSLFICHLKSMQNGRDDGRLRTHPVRKAEALAVRAIIEKKFGARWRKSDWIIAGDLNDYVETIGPLGVVTPMRPSALDPLLDDFAVNPVAGLPPHERWTHFHKDWSETKQRLIEEHVQLDYLLLSPALAARQPVAVDILRRGQPFRTPLDPRVSDRSIAALSATGGRYPRIGWDRPKASDHCPLVVTITLPRRPAEAA
ncbi:endonuclease/exonuclease/phosphatase family protein [Terrarubrum flagellatum]|uniref:endonuclease/exonuclease/phosphatase family protein n=1 Tax=Terrirubrum flagellatum TaxID=2895980 RepID=UPI003144FAD4